jgi:Spy/CpxP family protein refolding chaperone
MAMRTVLRLAAAGAALALVAGVAAAQFGGFGRGNPAMLLGQESVRKELKLTDEQIKKVEELSEKMREKFQEAFGLEGEERTKKVQELMKENEKAVAEILKPEQGKRLKQISYQQQGAGAFANADVAKELALTDDQKQEVQKINEETGAQIREIFQGGQVDEEGRKKIQELRKAATEKAVKVLNDEQKTKWKDLQGEPFKGEIVPFRRPGG